jgi:hypothetical protein
MFKIMKSFQNEKTVLNSYFLSIGKNTLRSKSRHGRKVASKASTTAQTDRETHTTHKEHNTTKKVLTTQANYDTIDTTRE